MVKSMQIKKAEALLEQAKKHPLSVQERCNLAIELASCLIEESQAIETHTERKVQTELAKMMKDPNGKVFTSYLTDQCFRSQDSKRIADQLLYLIEKFGIPKFLSWEKKLGLYLFKWLGKHFHMVFVPLIKSMLQKETERVIIPGESEAFKKHLDKRSTENVRLNINHLGEAILGEQEAEKRLQVYLKDLEDPNITCISIKISTICSQIHLIAWEKSLTIIMTRLKKLYQAAQKNGSSASKFINLDMEEYRDLRLTIEAFKRTLDLPEFLHLSAGIVLQSYLPDSFPLQKDLTEWAKKRKAKGGASIKIRLVKGANLAMEKVEASLRGWSQAPFENKNDVDANFKKMIHYACLPDHAKAVSIGIGSHNLFDICYAMLLRAENHLESYVNFEMLEGMADPLRRVVQQLSGDMLLYCPVAKKHEFQNAVAYLIRRLDENTAPSNFLRYSFNLKPGTKEWNEQADRFIAACHSMETVDNNPNRLQDRLQDHLLPSSAEKEFKNEPDTDWSLPQNRTWAEKIFQNTSSLPTLIPLVIGGKTFLTEDHMHSGQNPSQPGRTSYYYSLANGEHLELALQTAKNAEAAWQKTSIDERSRLLAKTAQQFRENRARLISAMILDTGKVISEADVEVSEAIDFAEYYRRSTQEINLLKDVEWIAKGTVLVTPPWNFPCSIPSGGILAALCTGNCVIFKPAPEAVLVGWELVNLFWKAGISKEVLQFFTCEDDCIGTQLVTDTRINSIVLTGATATAKEFLRLRPGMDLIAETGGKNAMVITALADRDLAVKDLVQSAFGHAGQKCSACSLAICEAEVYDDPQFRSQLLDAAASLSVGSPYDPFTRVNPLIAPPNPTLLRALTTLEEGEEWLLKPRQHPENPNLWSPGIKMGVKPGNFTYQNELFGPILGVMRAKNLPEAIAFANGTSYGLTSGIHSLDEREQNDWFDHIEAGNCYINRGITGAIVQRQPFGGCKDSSFGLGLKAGGPNYVIQFMHPFQTRLPVKRSKPELNISQLINILKKTEIDPEQEKIWIASIGSYAFYWKYYFSLKHDLSRIFGQDNILHYVPRKQITLRVQSQDQFIDALRVVAAALTCKCSLEVSISPNTWNCALKLPLLVNQETEEEFIQRIYKGFVNRVRLINPPSVQLQLALAKASCNVQQANVMANGRIELLHYLREVSLSRDYHRYGYLGTRENAPLLHQSSRACAPEGDRSDQSD